MTPNEYEQRIQALQTENSAYRARLATAENENAAMREALGVAAAKSIERIASLEREVEELLRSLSAVQTEGSASWMLRYDQARVDRERLEREVAALKRREELLTMEHDTEVDSLRAALGRFEREVIENLRQLVEAREALLAVREFERNCSFGAQADGMRRIAATALPPPIGKADLTGGTCTRPAEAKCAVAGCDNEATPGWYCLRHAEEKAGELMRQGLKNLEKPQCLTCNGSEMVVRALGFGTECVPCPDCAAQPVQPKCECVLSDAWRCAVSRNLQTISCHCACHRPAQPEAKV